MKKIVLFCAALLMAWANASAANELELKDITGSTFSAEYLRTITPLADGESIKDAMLVQMVSPVRWIDIMESMHRDGMRAYLEAGPKAVLGKMVSKCVPSMDGVSVGLACDQPSLESYL